MYDFILLRKIYKTTENLAYVIKTALPRMRSCGWCMQVPQACPQAQLDHGELCHPSHKLLSDHELVEPTILFDPIIKQSIYYIIKKYKKMK